jgi:hypothetical protein
VSIAEATPDLEQVDRTDRAFLGHPKGLGFLGFTEACERFSYYSMQTLLTLYMVNYLLVPGRMDKVIGLDWLQANVYREFRASRSPPRSSALTPRWCISRRSSAASWPTASLAEQKP